MTGHEPGYAALYSLIVNFAVAAVLSLVLDPVAPTRGRDETAPSDYHFEPAPAAAPVEKEPALTGTA